MIDHHHKRHRLGQKITRLMHLQQGLVSLRALARGLLLRFVSSHLLIEITLALTTRAGTKTIDTKIFGDEVPVNLKFSDQAPFAESLQCNQQEK